MAGRAAADEVLALGLARGWTVARAAAQASVSLRTAYTRLATPEFRDRVKQLRAELVSRAVGRLAAAGARAVQTLVRLLDNPDAQVQARAATALLNHMTRGNDVEDLRAEVEALKGQLEALERGRERPDTETSGPADAGPGDGALPNGRAV